jgi:hypothetical protein
MGENLMFGFSVQGPNRFKGKNLAFGSPELLYLR